MKQNKLKVITNRVQRSADYIAVRILYTISAQVHWWRQLVHDSRLFCTKWFTVVIDTESVPPSRSRWNLINMLISNWRQEAAGFKRGLKKERISFKWDACVKSLECKWDVFSLRDTICWAGESIVRCIPPNFGPCRRSACLLYLKFFFIN